MLERIHHVAVICSDYERSKDFYVRVLGLRVVRETLRAERRSYKLDLALPDGISRSLSAISKRHCGAWPLTGSRTNRSAPTS